MAEISTRATWRVPKAGLVNGTANEAAAANTATGSASTTIPRTIRKSRVAADVPGMASTRRAAPRSRR